MPNLNLSLKKEFRSTLADVRAHGDLRGHLRALAQTLTTRVPIDTVPNPQSPIPNPQAIQPGISVTVHGIPGHVLYPINVPGFWAITRPGRSNHSIHERDIRVVV